MLFSDFLISPMAATVVISWVRVMTGSGQMSNSKTKKNTSKHNQENQCETHSKKKKKTGGGDACVLLEALDQRFVSLKKLMYTRDISKPARLDARGKGRESGNLPETTSKPIRRSEGWWDSYLGTIP